MKKLLLAFLLSVAPLCADTVTDLRMAYESNRSLAVLFRVYAQLSPQVYGPVYQYFKGRADAFADAYFIVTGTRVE
jgi:hypothetical protein